MPTILSHAAVPLASRFLGGRRVSSRLLVAGVIASILPDADVIGFRLGIPYGHVMGHRGFSHSIVFALLLALAAFLLARVLRSGRAAAFLVVFVAAMSHGLLDAMTSGGMGIAFLSPFSNERFFFPWRPISVAPLSLSRMMNAGGLEVLRSEFTWVMRPLFAVGISGVAVRKTFHRCRKNSLKS